MAEPNPHGKKLPDRRGLGRGLGALLGGPDAPVFSDTLPSENLPARSSASKELRLSPASISPNPFQPRLVFDPVKLAELADSIRTHGVLQPLIVRRVEDGYQLVSGERRWRAAQQVGLLEVPVIVKAFSDQEALQIALVENVQREDITPLEAAAAYKRLAEEFGMTQEEIAKKVGKSRSAVANTMRLLALSSDERTALANGRISEGHARSLMGIQNPKEREGALLRLLSTGGTVRDVEQQARKSRVQAPPKPSATLPPRKDPHLSEVENRLRTVLGTKVEIDKGPQGRGILTIEFYDDEDLNRILETLGFNP